MKIFIGIVAFCFLNFHARSQSMTVADSAYLANLRTQLTLTDTQFDTIQTVYLKSQSEISSLEKELRIISRSDLADSLKSEKSTQLSLKKRQVREMLELDLQLLLNEEQKKIYAEKIKPAKPDISHFGVMHDRAKCVVCIPGKP
ncbi:MAG: hypothetical protein ACKVOK_07640 [Flavobacteriales bacterium]